MCIFVQCFNVKIGIRCYKIEHFLFPVAGPVFPAYIPAFDQYARKSVFGSKVDVTAYVFIARTVLWKRSQRIPVGILQPNIRCMCIIPRHGVGHMHSPPNSDIFLRLYIVGVFNFRWFVQIQNHFRSQNVSSLVAYHYCAPGCIVWCLHIGFCACGVGCQCRSEHHVFLIDKQMHS